MFSRRAKELQLAVNALTGENAALDGRIDYLWRRIRRLSEAIEGLEARVRKVELSEASAAEAAVAEGRAGSAREAAAPSRQERPVGGSWPRRYPATFLVPPRDPSVLLDHQLPAASVILVHLTYPSGETRVLHFYVPGAAIRTARECAAMGGRATVQLRYEPVTE